jgi:hypothetical protein
MTALLALVRQYTSNGVVTISSLHTCPSTEPQKSTTVVDSEKNLSYIRCPPRFRVAPLYASFIRNHRERPAGVRPDGRAPIKEASRLPSRKNQQRNLRNYPNCHWWGLRRPSTTKVAAEKAGMPKTPRPR